MRSYYFYLTLSRVIVFSWTQCIIVLLNFLTASRSFYNSLDLAVKKYRVFVKDTTQHVEMMFMSCRD